MPHDHVYEVPVAADPARDPHGIWVRAHPYISALLAAAALIFLGALIVERHTAVSTGQSQSGWNMAGILSNPTSYAPESQAPAQALPSIATDARITQYPPQQAAANTQPQSDAFDLDTFIAELTRPKAGIKAESTGASGSGPFSAYTFIPQGLVSTTTPSVARTDAQQKLFEYGNEAGSYIQSYEDTHHSQVQVLTDFINDRKDPSKAQAVKDLGQDLAQIGVSLDAMATVPSNMQNAHAALAKSYEDLGTKLSAVADTDGDKAFLSAINAYDTSVETETKRYVALVNLFSAAGVRFSPADSGSVFMFTAAGGL